MKQGFNRLVWDLPGAKRQPVQPGEYLMMLQTAGQKLTQKVRVLEPVLFAEWGEGRNGGELGEVPAGVRLCAGMALRLPQYDP